jgi:hypothetical protein
VGPVATITVWIPLQADPQISGAVYNPTKGTGVGVLQISTGFTPPGEVAADYPGIE